MVHKHMWVMYGGSCVSCPAARGRRFFHYTSKRPTSAPSSSSLFFWHESNNVKNMLWNIMYDRVLVLRVPTELTSIGFEDDLSVVVVAKHFEDAKLH